MVFQYVVTDNINRSERIVNQIKELIAQGKLKPNDKLPPERELAQMMNVSRTSVREAVKILSAMGLLMVKQGHGVFVQETNIASVLNRVTDLLVVKKGELMELLEVRKVLETQAIAWAVDRAADEELLIIQRLANEAWYKASDKSIDLAFAREHDAQFHGLIFSATHNHVLGFIMNGLYDVFERMRDITLNIPGRVAKSIEDHKEIATALIERNKDNACQAMSKHILSVEKSLREQADHVDPADGN